VWAIASESKIKQNLEQYRDYSKIVDEAEAIVQSLEQDGLIAK
jgi:exonuclease VII small subunit